MTDKKRLVHSTQLGDRRKQKGPTPGPRTSLPPQQHNLKIRRETKGRKGKTVTVVLGLALNETDLSELTKALKSLCGAGGTAKQEAEGQVIEIQGDHREKVADKLKSLGYKVKFAGG
jgi:translation initiation factor 1